MSFTRPKSSYQTHSKRFTLATCSNDWNYNVYLDIIATPMVISLVLPQPSLAPAVPLPKPNSTITPLFSHSCTMCTYNPFRFTFLQKTPGGWVSLPLSPSLPEMGRTDRIGAESKGPLWD